MSEPYTRRRLLTAGAAAGVAAVAGCSSSAEEEDEEPEPEGTELGEISIENVNDEDHVVDVLVEFDDEIEHWSTHELTADGTGVTLDRDWSSDPGNFRVTVRLDNADFTQITPAEWNDPSCLNLLVLVDRTGSVRVLSDTDGSPCGSGDPDFDGGN